MPTISTLTVDVVANTRSLSRGLKLASTAVLAVGAIATKMALDYEDAFVKIAAVSNASAKDVERWKEQVKDLAGETAQAPKELADALFFLASAGLKTNQIMPVLEASAKASAAGLGETAEVARLTANVLNAYAGSGIRAAEVTDILVAAVREGSADTDEFGTAIGRILPIASAAGIGFDSVAASLASLSNIGLDVNEGVTAMRGLFQALVSPTSAASKAMASVGLSAQDLLDSLQQDGLVGTIRLLDTAVKQNTGSQSEYMGVLRELVPNVRSLTGLLGLTGQEAERVDGLFQRVKESTGSLGEAFGTTAEGAGFKFRQALAEIQVLLIQIGDILLPVFVEIVGFFRDNVGPAIQEVGEWFSKLWQDIKPVAEIIGAVLLPLFQSAWHAVRDRLLPALADLSPIFKLIGLAVITFATIAAAQLAIVITVISHVVDIIGEIVKAFMKLVGWVRENLAEPIVGAIQKVIEWLQRAAEWIAERFMGAWNAVKGPVLAVIHAISGAIETLVGWIQNAIEALGRLAELAPGVGGQATTEAIQNVLPPGFPRAQAGGFVGRTGLALIHQGEHIIPADRGGLIGGDIVLNVDGREIARITRNELNRLASRNAGSGLR